jgi:hypothetical protein
MDKSLAICLALFLGACAAPQQTVATAPVVQPCAGIDPQIHHAQFLQCMDNQLANTDIRPTPMECDAIGASPYANLYQACQLKLLTPQVNLPPCDGCAYPSLPPCDGCASPSLPQAPSAPQGPITVMPNGNGYLIYPPAY